VITPGVWRIGLNGAIVTDCPTPGNCRICRDGHSEFYGGHFICESVGGTDAVLIAAAPTLLEKLRNLSQLADKFICRYQGETLAKGSSCSCPYHQIADEARDAIAKVEGL